jgi:hypothetical protein
MGATRLIPITPALEEALAQEEADQGGSQTPAATATPAEGEGPPDTG